jgi:hypothetical protein
MTSFFPTDAIRSRLEWNATLNPAAAPQTTEATKFLRKVIKPDTASWSSSYDIFSRRPSLRRSVSLKILLSSRYETKSYAQVRK